jgi:hypothetical protein
MTSFQSQQQRICHSTTLRKIKRRRRGKNSKAETIKIVVALGYLTAEVLFG